MPFDAPATRRGLLIVLSAPSGAGKSTLIAKLRERNPLIDFSVSTTTRPLRGGERDGIDYYFTDEPTFLRMIGNDEFIEHAVVHGNHYGTTRKTIERSLTAGRDILLDIDVQGAAQIRDSLPRARMAIPAVFIFVAPPSLAILEERLRKRGTDSEETILRRLKNAKEEMSRASEYDHIVVNDTIEDATARIEAFIATARVDAIRNARFRRPE
jgi:guanylate kinase